MTEPEIAASTTSPIYVTRIQKTRMPGYDHVWFRCEGCDLQGDMTGTNEQTDDLLTTFGSIHAERHQTEAQSASTVLDRGDSRHYATTTPPDLEEK